MLLEWIPDLFNDRNIEFTLDNFIKYVCDGFGLNSRIVEKFTSYTDEYGNRCLAHSHQFGIKWSKVLSQSPVPGGITELLSMGQK